MHCIDSLRNIIMSFDSLIYKTLYSKLKNKTNPAKYLGWTQVLRKGNQFLRD
jgi:hypothetical protein